MASILDNLIGAASQYAFDTIEIRTNATPSIVLNTKDLQGGSGAPNPLVKALQPTIILSGPAGQQTIAPYGEAGDAGGLVGFGSVAGVGGGLLLLGYLFGRASERRKNRRATRRLSAAVASTRR